MKLSNLDKYYTIVIQMHDNPDADAVGSGYALYRYFKARNKKVRLIYGGLFKITKSNILLLIKELNIPVEYVQELDKPELLLTVDCQYGEGNVQHFEGEHIAVIDHHDTGRNSGDMAEIRNHMVSCSAICYDMLKAEGFDVNEDISISTALYYGLYMDSNQLAEIHHPLERDMVDFLKIDKTLISRLTHANFTLQEMETAGIAMLRYAYDKKKRLAVIRSKPCDPNILGIVGDFVLQVDRIDVCVIFNENPNGYKLSVRSCVPNVAANDMAEFLTEKIGSGGGHMDKAGGFISAVKFAEVYDELGIEAYFFNRLEQYYASYDVIYARNGIEDKTGFRLYQKLPYTYGYVRTIDLFEEGTECKIRTYEGDVLVRASEDIYLMIGYYGEVYPIEKKAFERKYQPGTEALQKRFEYAPSVRNLRNDSICELLPYAKQCVCRENVRIFARPLQNPTKVFSKWDYEKYMYGNPDDYLCYTYNDDKDIYLIKKDVFYETYKECEQ